MSELKQHQLLAMLLFTAPCAMGVATAFASNTGTALLICLYNGVDEVNVEEITLIID